MAASDEPITKAVPPALEADKESAATHRALQLRRTLICGAFVASAAALVYVAGVWAWQSSLASLRQTGAVRLELYTSILDRELRRQDYLPAVVSLNPAVIELLNNPADKQLVEGVNRYLERLNAAATSTAVYVLDSKGSVLASSNWNEPISFVGIDLSYRPYFSEALQKGAARFYGIGTTSGQAGYYFAQAIRAHDRTLGVAVAKADLERIDFPWAAGADPVVIADDQGVIILTSEPDWKYRTLAYLPPTQQQRLRAARQYESVDLRPLGISTLTVLDRQTRIVSLQGTKLPRNKSFLVLEAGVADSRWSVLVLMDTANAVFITYVVQSLVGIGVGFVAVFGLYVRQRRRATEQRLAAQNALEHAYADLERKIDERTQDLSATNERLRREVIERKRAEQTLREAQDELIHAGKLAALGRMAASVAHEINQPLAALRTLCDNAGTLLSRGHVADASQNLTMVSDIIGRMAQISGQLKAFARKRTRKSQEVSVGTCLSKALAVLKSRIETQGVEITESFSSSNVTAVCDGGGLEQIFINVIGNALDAMREQTAGQIHIAVEADGMRTRISVRDNGPGIPDEIAGHLFEPFYTTKAAGSGLGLGLAICDSIVREHNGIIQAHNRPEGGAEFVIELPAPICEARKPNV